MLMIGIESFALTAIEREFLKHPAVAGVILFSRNFESKNQLGDLCSDIRTSSLRPQLIGVDQEGGRVQRFRDGYFKLPCLQDIGALFAKNKREALELARAHAYLMAKEVIASGLDLSFAPVADLALGNLAIGNRAFAAEPQMAADCIVAYIEGMHMAGMAATLKHFPGHGSVLEDTHFNAAEDQRTFEQISSTDLVPFRAGLEAGAEAVMMAHVMYPEIAPDPAGYSPYWIGHVLRQQMAFKGVVFSDDIGMAAAESAGGIKSRIHRHLSAGCDVVLACPPAAVADALEAMPIDEYPISKLDRLRAKSVAEWGKLAIDSRYLSAVESLQASEIT